MIQLDRNLTRLLTAIFMDYNPALYEAIAHQITTCPENRITFSTYMDLALYHPLHGYYSNQAANIGKKGDFFTSVHLGTDFGELLAEQFVQMWEILGKPQPFNLVEMGAGQGYLAVDLLNYIQQQYPDFYTCLDYTIVERSQTLRQVQQEKLSSDPSGMVFPYFLPWPQARTEVPKPLRRKKSSPMCNATLP